MNISLHKINPDDLHEVCTIYNYYIKNSTATFHTEEITIEEVENIIPISHPKYPSFLIKDAETICGYAYLGCYKPRQAYERTSEVTLYLDPKMSRKGIGSITLLKMEEIATQLNISVLLGIITGETNRVSDYLKSVVMKNARTLNKLAKNLEKY